MRPETGAMRFGFDWTGVFIRSDNAFRFAETLKAIYDEKWIFFHRETIECLIKLLESCNEQNKNPNTQKLKRFSACQEKK